MTASAAATLVMSLQARIDRTLAALIAPGTPVALLDYPDHWNVGDAAIWLGERAALGRLGCPMVHTCTLQDYDPALLARRVREGQILLHGGGNLGDLWFHHQVFRERVIHDFPSNPIIQLPQSVHFQDASHIVRFRRLCATHPRLRIILRDRPSHAFATTQFGIEALLAPDMAFGLGMLASSDSDRGGGRPIFWLSRTDKESSGAPLVEVGPECERRDWVSRGAGDEAAWQEAKRLRAEIDRLRAATREGHDPEPTLASLSARYDELAWVRVSRGLDMLSRGRVVITDRLHGHILSLCLGIPHVLLDNSYHKVRATYDSWTSASPLTAWATTPAEALARAAALIASRTG